MLTGLGPYTDVNCRIKVICVIFYCGMHGVKRTIYKFKYFIFYTEIGKERGSNYDRNEEISR